MAEYLDPTDLASIPELAGVAGVSKEFNLKKAAQVARSRLVVLAQQRLFTSARDYVKAIQPMRRETGAGGVERYVIKVLGALPWMVEHGMSAWDLRQTILKPGTRRLMVSKEGYLYVSIPFRHMGPGASGRNAQPMGSQFTESSLREDSRAFRGDLDKTSARTMGRAVFRDAKALAPTLSKPGGAGTPSGRMEPIFDAAGVMIGTRAVMRTGVQYGGRLAPGSGGAELLRARHVTDIFSGMVREEKTYEKATQSQFTTFRTISNNPESFREDEGGRNWTHPGITARHLVPEAKAYMEQLLSQGAFNA